MGYDDNKPLTGVTGGGLPAEIWHEVMTRVHEGLPARPLSIIVPEYRDPPIAENARTEPVAPQQQQPVPQQQIDPAEQVLRDVLGALGGNN
jgi:penicillin-binding protein 1A